MQYYIFIKGDGYEESLNVSNAYTVIMWREEMKYNIICIPILK